mmetsp:Transcript_17949/g.24602  ORF Transcript_17949/g.24602 Transcript_17949/m.24602 type:complete len:173 (+) Transcript_17949:513-1031(+)
MESSADKVTQLLSQCRPIEEISDCTLCLIKPHVMKNHTVGEILQAISNEGFSFKAFFTIHLTFTFAEELFDAYRNIYSNYSQVMEHLCSSSSLAVMVTKDAGSKSSMTNNSLVESFREIVGPHDPQLAKAIRPKSIRALFGEDMIRNAVHCTDLEEDGVMECKYFFDTLVRL